MLMCNQNTFMKQFIYIYLSFYDLLIFLAIGHLPLLEICKEAKWTDEVMRIAWSGIAENTKYLGLCESSDSFSPTLICIPIYVYTYIHLYIYIYVKKLTHRWEQNSFSYNLLYSKLDFPSSNLYEISSPVPWKFTICKVTFQNLWALKETFSFSSSCLLLFTYQFYFCKCFHVVLLRIITLKSNS